MPKLFHKPLRSKNSKVFLTTPVIGSPVAGYVFSLHETIMKAVAHQVPIEYCLYQNDCHVDDARNKLVSEFLKTDCDKLVFIDSDIEWNAEEFIRLVKHDADVVAGIYPHKNNHELTFPVAMLGEDVDVINDLVEVAAVPTGFLCIKRQVLEVLADKAEKFEDKSSGDIIPLIFERTVRNNKRMGGDFTFCFKWREMGGSIYIDPEIELTHVGETTYKGSVAHQNRIARFGAVGAGLLEIVNKKTSATTYNDMVTAWGNEWAIDAGLLTAISEMEMKGDVLEIGSGLSTLVLAAKNPHHEVHCLEHDKNWKEFIERNIEAYNIKNVTVHHCPLKQNADGSFWYDIDFKGREWGTVFCDAPPREYGSRKGVFDMIPSDSKAMFIADDADSPGFLDSFKSWENGRDSYILGKERKFLISKVTTGE